MSDRELEYQRQQLHLVEAQTAERMRQGELENDRRKDQTKDKMCEPVWKALKDSGQLTHKTYF